MQSNNTSIPSAETILLVEDDPIVQTVLCETLERFGYTVLTARSGPEALHLGSHYQGPVHLLVTDVVLPQLSGPELSKRLSLSRPTMRTMYMSGYPDNVLARYGLDAQLPFLRKPFSISILGQMVRTILDRSTCPHQEL